MNKTRQVLIFSLLSGLYLNQAAAESKLVSHDEKISIEKVGDLVLSEVTDSAINHAPEAIET